MSMKMPAVSSGGGSYDPAPEGNHLAVCYQVVDFGTQPSVFNGETNYKPIVYIGWELPDELMSDGRPFAIGKQYTYSSHPKATLRRDLESWRGKKFSDAEIEDFDIAKLLGAGCMLGVQHAEKQKGPYLNLYANVSTVAKLPRGIQAPKPHNKLVEFSLADFDPEVFDSLRDWMKDKIRAAPEFRAAAGFPPADQVSTVTRLRPKANDNVSDDEDLSDDIPF